MRSSEKHKTIYLGWTNRAVASAFYTHVNEVRQVVDVVFENGGVRRFQRQEVLVPRFDRLQLVLGVLGLALMRE